MKHTYSAGGVNCTVNIEQLSEQLENTYDDGRDTQMAVNTKQQDKYLRMDGYYMGKIDAITFSFQDKAEGGEYYVVKFTEIVRTY